MPPKAKDTDAPDADQQTATTPRWLTELEATVRRTTEEIRRLREENRTLGRRVEELEESLATAQKEHVQELEAARAKARAAAEADSGDEAAAAWREERDEIRGRVERLTGKLASLLEQASETDEADDDGSSSD